MEEKGLVRQPLYMASDKNQQAHRSDKNSVVADMEEIRAAEMENRIRRSTNEAMEEYLNIDEATLLDTQSKEYE